MIIPPPPVFAGYIQPGTVPIDPTGQGWRGPADATGQTGLPGAIADGLVTSGLVALPGGQAGALGLSGRVNVVETGGTGTAVRVQVVGLSMWQTVHNRTGVDLIVYPGAGEQFENYGVNMPVAIPNAGGATYVYDGAQRWVIG